MKGTPKGEAQMIYIGSMWLWRASGLVGGAIRVRKVLLENLGVTDRVEIGVSLGLLSG